MLSQQRAQLYLYVVCKQVLHCMHTSVTIVSDTLQLPLSAVEDRGVLRRSSSAAVDGSSSSSGGRLTSTNVISSSAQHQSSAAAQVCIAYCAYSVAFYY
jgi:hypothetical protein